jgi:hypothetical protein
MTSPGLGSKRSAPVSLDELVEAVPGRAPHRATPPLGMPFVGVCPLRSAQVPPRTPLRRRRTPFTGASRHRSRSCLWLVLGGVGDGASKSPAVRGIAAPDCPALHHRSPDVRADPSPLGRPGGEHCARPPEPSLLRRSCGPRSRSVKEPLRSCAGRRRRRACSPGGPGCHRCLHPTAGLASRVAQRAPRT